MCVVFILNFCVDISKVSSFSYKKSNYLMLISGITHYTNIQSSPYLFWPISGYCVLCDTWLILAFFRVSIRFFCVVNLFHLHVHSVIYTLVEFKLTKFGSSV